MDKLSDSPKRLLRVLGRGDVDRPPIWLMRQAGRYLPEYRQIRAKSAGFLDLCYDSQAAAEVTLQPIRRFGFDAAILFADILLVPHALGQDVAFREGEGPVLDPIRDAAALAKLRSEGIGARLDPVFETIRRVRAELDAETALIGFAGAPWTVATYMVEGGSSRDFAAAKGWAYRDRHGFETLLDILATATVEYLSAQIAAGVEVLQLFDSWAGAVPDQMFDSWVVAPTRKIIDALKARHPEIPVILFPNGAGLRYSRLAEIGGADAIAIDTTVPLAWAAKALQPTCVIQGNLDPQLLMAGGEPMRRGAEAILAAFADGPHIFNLGHGIQPTTPIEHVAELCKIIRGWRR